MANIQTIQSKNKMTEALLYWMKQEPYAEITVTQICQQAGLVRQTFYRNFESKEAILLYYMDELFEQFAANHELSQNLPDLQPTLRDCFCFLSETRDFLILLEQNDLFLFMQQSIAKNLDKMVNMAWLVQKLGNPSLERYLRSYIASVFSCVLKEWVHGNFAEDVDTLVALTYRLFQGLAL